MSKIHLPMQSFRFHHSISQKVIDLKVMIGGTNLEFSHHYFVVLSFFVRSLCVNIFLHLKQEKFFKLFLTNETQKSVATSNGESSQQEIPSFWKLTWTPVFANQLAMKSLLQNWTACVLLCFACLVLLCLAQSR